MTELFIRLEENWYQLDLDRNMPFDIQYSLADVKDLSSRNISYTKTIVLPGTKNNNKLFGYIYDINRENNKFLLSKTKCYVTNNNIQIFSGYLQILKINNDYSYSTYEVTLSSDIINLITQLDNKFLNDVDVSELDHDTSSLSVENSWTNTYLSGYFYPLIDYNYNWNYNDLNVVGIKSTDLYPALYVKYLFDRLIQDTGFTYESNFLNSDYFKKLIIPTSNKNLTLGSNFVRDNMFKVSTLENYFIDFEGVVNGSSNQVNELLDNKKVKLGDESNPNFDKNNLFDINTYEYIHKVNNINNKFVFELDIDIFKEFQPNPAPSSGFDVSNGGDLFIRILRDRDISGNLVPTGVLIPLTVGNIVTPNSVPYPYITNPMYFLTNPSGKWPLSINKSYPGDVNPSFFITPIFNDSNIVNKDNATRIRYNGIIETVYLDNSSSNTYPLFDGERVWVEVNSCFRNGYITNTIIPSNTPPFKINRAIFYNKPSSINLDGSRSVSLSSTLPNNYKSITFFNDIVKMFNLFIEVDKDDPNNLLIETRYDFYKNYKIKDWTRKVDLSKGTRIELISQKENNTVLFTYKQDSDNLNKEYKENFNRIFGDFVHSTENQNTIGVKKIEINTSPTINKLIEGSIEFNIPAILSDSGKPGEFSGSNMRILFRNNTPLYENQSFKMDGKRYPLNPYAGLIDNPNNPQNFLGFGIPSYSYDGVPNFPRKNLYNTFWKDMLDETMEPDSRLYTINTFLNAQDISNFNFSDLIYLELDKSSSNNYFKVNKISYSPNVKDSYEVELILVNNITPDLNLPQCGDFLINGIGTQSEIVVNSSTTSEFRGSSLTYPLEFDYDGDDIKTFNNMDLGFPDMLLLPNSGGSVVGEPNYTIVNAIKITKPATYLVDFNMTYEHNLLSYGEVGFLSNVDCSMTFSVKNTWNLDTTIAIPFVESVDTYYAYKLHSIHDDGTTYRNPCPGTYEFYVEIPWSIDVNWTISGPNAFLIEFINIAESTQIGDVLLVSGLNSGTFSGTFSFIDDSSKPLEDYSRILLRYILNVKSSDPEVKYSELIISNAIWNLVNYTPENQKMEDFNEITPVLYLVDVDNSGNVINNIEYKTIYGDSIMPNPTYSSGTLSFYGEFDIGNIDFEETTNLYLYPAFTHTYLHSRWITTNGYTLTPLSFSMSANIC